MPSALDGFAVLADIVHGVPAVSFLLDSARRIQWMSEEAAGVVRQLLDREATLGILLDELVTPEMMEDFHEHFAGALAGRGARIPRVTRYPSGAIRKWEVNFIPVRDPGGPVSGVLFGVRDIEDPDAARERMQLFERAVGAAVVGVAVADARDPELPLTFVNPGFERMTGYSASELVGRNCRFLQGTDREQPGIGLLRAAIQEGRPEHVVLRNYRKDGSLFWNSITLSPVRNERGEVTHIVGMQQDVTEAYEAQARLLRAARMEAAGQLAAGIAHDVNNLLTVLQMNASVLAQSPDAMAVEIAGDLEMLSSRAHTVIRRLLTFARGEASEPVALELGTFLTRLDHLIRPLLGTDIELVVLPPQEPVTVRIDPASLEQVLVNLVINARHAMPGGGTLRVAVEPRADASVVIAVSDSGSGMTAEVMGRIFEPFFTTRADSGGTGLGLSTSRRLMREAGGDLEVRSAQGHGTTFHLVLPTVPTPPREEAASQAAREQPVGGTETILLADDEEAVRRWMARALRQHGYRVIEVSDGAEALELAARERPDLVICDAVMPRVGARGVLTALAQRPHAPPVIVASGYGPGVLDGMAERPAALLTKSFTLAELTHCVRAVLDRVAGRPIGASARPGAWTPPK